MARVTAQAPIPDLSKIQIEQNITAGITVDDNGWTTNKQTYISSGKKPKWQSNKPIITFNGPNPIKDTGKFAKIVSEALENNTTVTPENGTWGLFLTPYPRSEQGNIGYILVLGVLVNGEWKIDLSDVPIDYKVVWKGRYRRVKDDKDIAGVNTDNVYNHFRSTMEKYEEIWPGTYTLVTLVIGNNPPGSSHFKKDVRVVNWLRYMNSQNQKPYALIGDYITELIPRSDSNKNDHAAHEGAARGSAARGSAARGSAPRGNFYRALVPDNWETEVASDASDDGDASAAGVDGDASDDGDASAAWEQ